MPENNTPTVGIQVIQNPDQEVTEWNPIMITTLDDLITRMTQWKADND